MFRNFADIIGMTLVPECQLAREKEICYVTLAMVTDYDVWAEKPVSTKEVIKTMGKNVGNVKKVLRGVLGKLPAERTCECKSALGAAQM
jgi:5'-methylthioadenosine phosphorylase